MHTQAISRILGTNSWWYAGACLITWRF